MTALATRTVKESDGKTPALYGLTRFSVFELEAYAEDLVGEIEHVVIPQWKVNAVWDALLMALPVTIVIVGKKVVKGKDEFYSIIQVIRGTAHLEPRVMVCADVLPDVEKLNVRECGNPISRRKMLHGCEIIAGILESEDSVACDKVNKILENWSK